MITIEHTDTFGGEANYCWAKRWHTARELTDLQLVRLAKRLTGLTGIRCRVDNYGDQIEIRPAGICQIVFVSYAEKFGKPAFEDELSHTALVSAGLAVVGIPLSRTVKPRAAPTRTKQCKPSSRNIYQPPIPADRVSRPNARGEDRRPLPPRIERRGLLPICRRSALCQIRHGRSQNRLQARPQGELDSAKGGCCDP